MNKQERATSPFLIAAIVIVVLFGVYLVSIALWDSTSVKYKPANALDFEVKTPSHKLEWFNRREHGI